MKHQHNKIRKISTTSLVDLLLCNEAGNLIDDIYMDVIKAINSNSKLDVFLNIFGVYEPYEYDENYIKSKKTIIDF